MDILYHHRTRAEDVEGVHIRGIVHALRSLSHRVDVVSPPGVDVDRGTLSAGGETDQAKARPVRGMPSWAMVSRWAPAGMFERLEVAYNAWAWPALEARVRLRRYELLYERYALFSIAGVMTARRNRVPIILEVNDSAQVSRIRPLRMQAAARRAERFIWLSADAIVTVTSYFRDLIVEVGVPAARVHVIPNGVDAARLEAAEGSELAGAAVRRRLGLEGAAVVGYVGAVNFWRRIDLLVDAFAPLALRHPTARLLLVGDGPDRGAVEARVRELKLGDRVRFAGKVPHAEIADYLAAVDVAVLPHSNTYGSPMKLFEYMAAGRPVVAPWLPPIVSVLGDGGGGLLFRPLDRGSLERALDEMLANPELRRRAGQLARDKVRDRYVWSRHAEAIVGIQAGLRRGGP